MTKIFLNVLRETVEFINSFEGFCTNSATRSVDSGKNILHVEIYFIY
jgi:hypothetical protein